MKNNSLHISESFYSIQGEGKTTGVPAVFLRLSGCNLLCQSENWVCDSIAVWKKGKKTPFENVFNELTVDRLKNGAHLVITGGEPMLHQESIISFITWFKKEFKFKPFIEIETNGTIEPMSKIKTIVNQWNVSPKLLNSGELFEKRFQLDVLKQYNKLNSTFKFVVQNEMDVIEIFTNYHFVNKNRVYLMPAGSTQKELKNVRTEVIELCKKYLLKFTDRIHIVAWNKKTGV